MNQVSDLFMLEKGQVMTMPVGTPLTEIYAEAAMNDTPISVSLNIYDEPVVTLSTDGKIADFTRTLVMGDLDSVVMTVPTGMKESSIKTSVYGLTQGTGFKYGVKFDDGKVKVTKSERPLLGVDFNLMKPGHSVRIRTENPASTKVALYRKAKAKNKRIKIKVVKDYLDVYLMEGKATEVSTSYARAFMNWVSCLKHGIPTEIPAQFKDKSEEYMRTCISKAGLDVLMAGGTITRQIAVLKLRKGVMTLRIKDTDVARFDVNIGSRYVRKEHREKITELLRRTGLTYEDLK